MCGIIGVAAIRPAVPIMLDALKRLEYRGYDSAGVATLDRRRLARRRAPGKLSELAERLACQPLPGTIGIGHTRWATHGAPNEANAHPHIAGPVAVVHNGIIENAGALAAELRERGHSFESETDTEVVAHLCADHIARGLKPVDAAAATLKRLRGAYALCFMFEGAEDLLVCARRGSPLAIGYGTGEMFVGSDALALAPMTSEVAYLDEGDWAAITRAGATIFDAAELSVARPVRNVALDARLADKNCYRHFMAKEIHEQPQVLGYAIARNLSAGRDSIVSPASALPWEALSRATLIACGTAHYACHVGKYWFESVARLPVDIDVASEFRYRTPPLPEDGLAVVVSQSGETADTLAALRYAREAGQTTVAVVNAEHSSMAREADLIVPIGVGPEIGVASSKAFTGQLVALAGLAILAGRRRGKVDAGEEARLTAALATVPQRMADTLRLEPRIAEIAAEIAAARDVLYVGRGRMYPLALEGALKLKELTYIHAEGYAAGELKHGPIALVEPKTPTIALAPRDGLFEKTLSNIREITARHGRVVLVTDAAGAAEAGDCAWRLLTLPDCDPLVAPIVYAAVVQLLAYHAAVAKGADVDQPRNLAKSVTVE
ncbi:MAG: glutamine--fructose-6-phosphate transaminase (isomerizing) [Amaricoccus sp.]